MEVGVGRTDTIEVDATGSVKEQREREGQAGRGSETISARCRQ